MMKSARHAVLSEIATFDKKTGELRVVIETPKCKLLDVLRILAQRQSPPRV
jgi:hypothetical protein